MSADELVELSWAMAVLWILFSAVLMPVNADSVAVSHDEQFWIFV
jgi:hypothetical protein